MSAGEHFVGTPIEATITSTAAYTTTQAGEPLAAYVASGMPGKLNVTSSRTGELIASRALVDGKHDSVGSRALAAGVEDRIIYVGLRDGRGYSFDPDTKQLESLPTAPKMKGERFWDAVALDDGRILFATYPTAKVLSYDPSSEKWRDYGSFGAGNKYALGLSASGNMAYLGTGTKAPSLWQLDTESGKKQEISLPTPENGTSRDFVYDTEVVADRVFARVESENKIYVYDTTERKWIASIQDAIRGIAAPVSGSPPGLYWVGTDGHLRFSKDDGGEETVLGGGDGFAALRGTSWQDIDGDGSRESLVTINVSGEILRWNSESDERTLLPTNGEPAPVRIRSLGLDPQGEILVGGMGTSPYFSRVPTDGGEPENYHLRGQVESFGSLGNDIVVGTYPGAEIDLIPGDLSEPPESVSQWQLENRQDRPIAMEELEDGRIAIASMPVYGEKGGALSFIGAEHGVEMVRADVSPGRSPLTLAEGLGRIFIGTGSTGGYGTKRDAGDGTVVVVDSDSGRTLKTVTPIPGDATVAALKFDASGRLWGWTVDSIFEMDPVTLKVKRQKRYSKAADDKAYARGRNLVDLGDQLAGSARGKIFLINKKTLKKKDITKGANLVLGHDGDLYFSRGAGLYRWVFELTGKN